MMYYLFNENIVRASDALVPVTDLALLRGYGIFDFFRLIGHKPLFIDDHVDRFFRSASKLRLQCPLSGPELISSIMEMLQRNRIKDSGVRLVLTGGPSPNGYSIGQPTLFAINEPITPLPESHFSEGIKIITCEYLRDIPEVKTINYLMGIYKMPEIQAADALDVLFHWKGMISELTRSNFYIVNQEGAIVTPATGILEGITRKKVLGLAADFFTVDARPLHLDEVYAAKEAFITGTTKKVMPVVNINGHLIGNGKPGTTTRKLQFLFQEYIEDFLGGH
jgi:D-alanine transaminase/branched-chain amino acid aminotransferase